MIKTPAPKIPDILCIGSVLWDIIGRTRQMMPPGSDVPGRIHRLPGGVAMNIAMSLNRLGLPVALLSAIGRDPEGRDLMRAATDMGLIMRYVFRPHDLATDRYMAIEAVSGLIGAIADAHSLEAAGVDILKPLYDGRLASDGAPWSGTVVLDGNLSSDMMQHIANSALFDTADLRLAPASPGKAARLGAFLGHRRATLYLNLAEADVLTKRRNATTAEAAQALLNTGLHRVLVTDGMRAVAEASQAGDSRTASPAPVPVPVETPSDLRSAG